MNPLPDSTAIEIVVVRFGGMAGLRRTWSVAADPPQATPWLALVDLCPWDEVANHSGGSALPDRYTWHIAASVEEVTRSAELAEVDAVGPWRHLIDAVRTARHTDEPPANSDPADE